MFAIRSVRLDLGWPAVLRASGLAFVLALCLAALAPPALSAPSTARSSAPKLGWGWGPNVQVLDAAGLRRLDFQVAGAQRVRVRLYSVSPERFLALYDESYQGLDFWDEQPKDIDVSGLAMVREFTVRTGASPAPRGYYGDRATFTVPPDVAPGLYIVKLSAVNAESVELFLAITRHTIVLKQTDGQLIAWVASIGDWRPAAAASVGAYAEGGLQLAGGVTDEHGVFRADGLPQDRPLLVFANVGGDVTLSGLSPDWRQTRWSWWWDGTPPAAEPWAAAVYTDRPIYRPGQTVYVKAVLRADRDAQLTVAAGQPVTLRLRDARDYVVGEQALVTNAFGSVNTEFALAEGGTTGTYHAELLVGDWSLRQPLKVEAYRKPELEVSVTTDRAYYARGDTMTVTVTARYLYGQPAAGLPVSLGAFGLVFAGYDWETGEAQHQWAELNTPLRNGVTDADGRWVLQLAAPEVKTGYEYYDGWDSWRDNHTVALEATVFADGEPISGHASLPVYRAAFGLSLALERRDVSPIKPVAVSLAVRDHDGSPRAGVPLTVRVYGWNRAHGDMDGLLQTVTTKTGEDGSAVVQLTLTQQGYFEVRAQAKDAQGRELLVEDWLWVYEGNGGAGYWNSQIGAVSIQADRERYAPGDVAQLLISSPVTGTALLTLERGSTREAFPVVLTGLSTVVPLTIRPDYAPNIHATINVYRPLAPNDERFGWQSYRDAELLSASVDLAVPPEDRRLVVSVSPDRAEAAPGESVELSVQVSAPDGAPVQAELSIAVVDEAIYQLSADLSPDLFDAFYYPRSNVVQTYDALRPYRYLPDGMGGGGGGDSGLEGGLRRNFPDTAYWQPALVTGPDGRAIVRVALPDSLTRWRVVVRAVTADDQVRAGEGGTAITVTRAIVVRPLLPATLVQYDVFTLSAVVRNHGAEPVELEVWAALSALRHDGTAITQTLTLAPGASAVVGWPVTAAERGVATVRLYARGKAGADAVELTVPVVPRAAGEVSVQAGQVVGEAVLTAIAPSGVLTDVSTLEIELSPTVAGGLLAGLEYLTGYPYGCVEQTMSRALPNAAVSRAFRLAGVDAGALSPELTDQINAGLQRLYGFQHGDGGWGWWFSDASDPYQTAWVLYGLVVTRDAGYTVDEQAIARGADWLAPQIAQLEPHTRAYALYALALAGKGDLPATQALAAQAGKVNLFGRAALALALERLGDRAGAITVLDGLERVVASDGVTAYWRSGTEDGHYHDKYMASNVRTTALVLAAYVRLRPESPLVEQTVLWLMGRRTPGGWGTTQETAYAVIALSDYLARSVELAGSPAYTVEINGVAVADGVFARATGATASRRLVLPARDLAPGANIVRITQTGGGRLYYVVTTRLYREQTQTAAAGPLTVQRAYLDERGRPLAAPITPGTILTVRLTVRVPADSWYVLVEDRLPGGFVALNERLATASYDSAVSVGDSPEDGWRRLGYNFKDVRDDRVAFFITRLGPGAHTFSYRVRALQGGAFHALPAEVTLMYDPSSWGRSASAVVTVVEPGQTVPARPLVRPAERPVVRPAMRPPRLDEVP